MPIKETMRDVPAPVELLDAALQLPEASLQGQSDHGVVPWGQDYREKQGQTLLDEGATHCEEATTSLSARGRRIEAIRDALAKGTYHISASDVAAKLLTHMLEE